MKATPLKPEDFFPYGRGMSFPLRKYHTPFACVLTTKISFKLSVLCERLFRKYPNMVTLTIAFTKRFFLGKHDLKLLAQRMRRMQKCVTWYTIGYTRKSLGCKQKCQMAGMEGIWLDKGRKGDKKTMAESDWIWHDKGFSEISSGHRHTNLYHMHSSKGSNQKDIKSMDASVYQKQIQRAHYNQNQFALLTAASWICKKTWSHSIVSDNLDHTEAAIVPYVDRHKNCKNLVRWTK